VRIPIHLNLESTMIKHALFVRLEAKPGKDKEVAQFLQAGLGMAQQEGTTPVWFALQLGPATFGIFDAFADEAGRQAFAVPRREGRTIRFSSPNLTQLHMSFVDTDLASAIDAPKSSPDEIVKRALDALESGFDEVLADEATRLTKQGLTAPRPSYLPQGA
jgi:hypothetical protein